MLIAYGLCAAAVAIGLWGPLHAGWVCVAALWVGAGTHAAGEVLFVWFAVTGLASAVRGRPGRWLGRWIAVGTIGLFTLAVFGGITDSALWPALLGWGLSVLLGTATGFQYAAVRRRGREELALQSAREDLHEAERLSIAQHLHDAVGHSLTYIALEVAVHAPSEDPQTLRDALERIQGSTEQASAQLSQLLRFLREGSTGAWPQTLPDPADIERRGAEQLTACGWTVRRDLDDTAFRAPEPVRSVLAGAIAEAYANIIKHARPRGAVHTTLVCRGSTLILRIDSPLSEAHPAGESVSQLGLSQLTERIEAVRGTITVQARGGIWSLEVALPIDAGIHLDNPKTKQPGHA